MSRRTIARLLLLLFTAATVTMLLLAGAGPAGAVAPDPPPTDPTVELNAIITNLRLWVMGLCFGVGTLFLTIGFLRRQTANGDPAEIEKSNAAFRNAVLGYAGAVLAPTLMAIAKGLVGG